MIVVVWNWTQTKQYNKKEMLEVCGLLRRNLVILTIPTPLIMTSSLAISPHYTCLAAYVVVGLGALLLITIHHDQPLAREDGMKYYNRND